MTFARLIRHAELRRIAIAAAVFTATALPATSQTAVPRGGEVRVNTYWYDNERESSVALSPNGDFVIAWQGDGHDGAGTGIYAQRYTAAGVPAGGEFRVNSYTPGDQRDPSATMDAAGNFVVAWHNTGLNEIGQSIYGVFIQRYIASGVPWGGEVQVNTLEARSHNHPSVAMDADGDLVVTWENINTGNQGGYIYARRYTPSGTPLGGQFIVSPSRFDQFRPSVAVAPSGEFVIAWQDAYRISAQRFAASGTRRGGTIQVDTYTGTEFQFYPSVAMDADGDFVVAWQNEAYGRTGRDGSGSGVYARQYTAAGVPVGDEFRVNSYTPGDQKKPSVAMNNDGSFVVTWTSANQNGQVNGIYAQSYTSTGTLVGSEFRVSPVAGGDQQNPSMAVDADGDFVVAWESIGQDGAGFGIYARRFSRGLVAAEPGATSGLSLSAIPNPVGTRGGTVRVVLPQTGPVRLSVVDALGREVAVLLDGVRPAGAHEVPLDTSGLTAGVYVVRLVAGGSVASTRLIVAR